MTSCEQCRAEGLDAITTDTPLPEGAAAHVKECDACRAELHALQRLWLDVAAAPVEPPTDESARRISAALRNAILTERKPMRNSMIAAALVAGVLLGAGGTAAALRTREAPTAAPPTNVAVNTAAPSPAGHSYMLLLHEEATEHSDAKPEQIETIVAEYTAWADKLASANQLIGAEELQGSSRMIDDKGTRVAFDESKPATGDMVSGYFIIRAASYDEAVALAKESPHLKYGGSIEVRPIVDAR